MTRTEFDDSLEPLHPDSVYEQLSEAFRAAGVWHKHSQPTTGKERTAFDEQISFNRTSRSARESQATDRQTVETPNRYRKFALASIAAIALFGAYQINSAWAGNRQEKTILASLVPQIASSATVNFEQPFALATDVEELTSRFTLDIENRYAANREYSNAIFSLIRSMDAVANHRDFHAAIKALDSTLDRVGKGEFGRYTADVYTFTQLAKGFVLLEHGMDSEYQVARPTYILKSLICSIEALQRIDGDKLAQIDHDAKVKLNDIQIELIDLKSVEHITIGANLELDLFAKREVREMLQARALATLATAFHKFNIDDPRFDNKDSSKIKNQIWKTLIGEDKTRTGGLLGSLFGENKPDSLNMLVIRAWNDRGMGMQNSRDFKFEELEKYYERLLDNIRTDNPYGRALTLTNLADTCQYFEKTNREIELRNKAIDLMEKLDAKQPISYGGNRVLRKNYFRCALALFKNDEYEQAIANISSGNSGSWKFLINPTNSTEFQIANNVQINQFEKFQVALLTLFTNHRYPDGIVERILVARFEELVRVEMNRIEEKKANPQIQVPAYSSQLRQSLEKLRGRLNEKSFARIPETIRNF